MRRRRGRRRRGRRAGEHLNAGGAIPWPSRAGRPCRTADAAGYRGALRYGRRQLHHGELAVEQCCSTAHLRAAQYAPPCRGCGWRGRAAPGGGINGAAGWNAARRYWRRRHDRADPFQDAAAADAAPSRTAANVLNCWGRGRYMTALCFGDADMEYTAIRTVPSTTQPDGGTDHRARCGGSSEPADPARCAKLPVGAVHYTGWNGRAASCRTTALVPPRAGGLSDCCQERYLPCSWPPPGVRGGGDGVTEGSLRCPAGAMLGHGLEARASMCGPETFPQQFPLGGAEITVSAPALPAIWGMSCG